MRVLFGFVILAAVVLGYLLPKLETGATVRAGRADQILYAVGFGILGLITLIYSLLFIVVQSSNTTFTPRLNLFQDDPWIYRTYALALGLFTFAMTASLAMGDDPEVTVVLPIFAFVGALVVLALMRNVQAKAFASLQLNTTLDTLMRRGRETIEVVYLEWRPESPARPLAPTGGRPVRWPRPQSTLQQLELRRLLGAADRSGSVVVLRVRVGETLWPGGTVAEVSGPLDDDAVVASLMTGVHRTFDQDPLLAFRLLADIGLRALSPAINDPATALQVVDALVGLLLVLAPRDLADRAIEAPSGGARIHVDLPDWEDFVREGLDELLVAAKGSPMVLDRARTTLTQLAEQVPPQLAPALRVRLRAVQDGLGDRGAEPSEPDDALFA